MFAGYAIAVLDESNFGSSSELQGEMFDTGDLRTVTYFKHHNRALAAMPHIAAKFPTKQVVLLKAVEVAVAKAGPLTAYSINEQGEVFPK